jgi:hypothetical protein
LKGNYNLGEEKGSSSFGVTPSSAANHVPTSTVHRISVSNGTGNGVSHRISSPSPVAPSTIAPLSPNSEKPTAGTISEAKQALAAANHKSDEEKPPSATPHVNGKISEKISSSIENLKKAAESSSNDNLKKASETPSTGAGVSTGGASGAARKNSDRPAPLAKNTSFNKFAQASAFANNKCTSCAKTVYPVEQLAVESSVFHKNCFRCAHCNNILSLGKYASLEGKVIFNFLLLIHSTIASLISNSYSL